jgi:hypothetical protein
METYQNFSIIMEEDLMLLISSVKLIKIIKATSFFSLIKTETMLTILEEELTQEVI